MPKQPVLRPLDIPVALKLSQEPEATFESIGDDLGLSASTAHGAVRRLQDAGLVRPESRKVNRHALLEFLEHGVRYAFPPQKGGPARGVPTAHSAPVLADQILADDSVVWPSAEGSVVGQSLTPLYDDAPALARRSPRQYEMLALVDALRLGGARERAVALAELRQRLYPAAA